MITITDVKDQSKGSLLQAKIPCPECKKKMSSLLRTNDSGVQAWNLSNYVRHIKQKHPHVIKPTSTRERKLSTKRNTRQNFPASIEHIEHDILETDRSLEKASDFELDNEEEEPEVKRRKLNESHSEETLENNRDCN